MTLPAPVDLLRSIYRRLDREAVCADFPDMALEELDGFFRTLSLVCQGDAPSPMEGGGLGASAPEKLRPGDAARGKAPSNAAGSAREVTLFTDGGSRGNPGPAGYGFVLLDASGQEVARGRGYLGRTTNNVAEYAGVAAGLQAALEAGAKSITLKSDSELIVKQLRGTYRVKAPGLKDLFAKVKGLLAKFPSWQAVHVPREQNQLADALANEAMDEGE